MPPTARPGPGSASGDDAGLLQPLPDAVVPALLAPNVLVCVGLRVAGSGAVCFRACVKIDRPPRHVREHAHAKQGLGVEATRPGGSGGRRRWRKLRTLHSMTANIQTSIFNSASKLPQGDSLENVRTRTQASIGDLHS